MSRIPRFPGRAGRDVPAMATRAVQGSPIGRRLADAQLHERQLERTLKLARMAVKEWLGLGEKLLAVIDNELARKT